MSDGPEMTVLGADEVEAVYRDISRKLGASESEAGIFAGCYLRADLRGLYTAGAAVVPYIVSLIEADLMRFGVPFDLVADYPAMAVVDGHYGVGSIVAWKAMELAMDKASEVGVGAVAVRNGGDFGLATNHVLQAVDRGQIGIAMRNGTPRVAPWGGRMPLFGTNPLAVGVPTGSEPPIVIDMAAGSFSVGGTVMAARDGRRMPSAHLVDRDGRYVDDPRRIVVDPTDRESAMTGAIVTLGHKGYCWQLIVEVLAGLLSGMGLSSDNDFQPDDQHRWSEGTLLLAVDVAKALPLAEFTSFADRLANSLRQSPPAEGFTRVLVPGENAAKIETDRLRNGVPIRSDDWKAVERVCDRLDITFDRAGAGR